MSSRKIGKIRKKIDKIPKKSPITCFRWVEYDSEWKKKNPRPVSSKKWSRSCYVIGMSHLLSLHKLVRNMSGKHKGRPRKAQKRNITRLRNQHSVSSLQIHTPPRNPSPGTTPTHSNNVSDDECDTQSIGVYFDSLWTNWAIEDLLDGEGSESWLRWRARVGGDGR